MLLASRKVPLFALIVTLFVVSCSIVPRSFEPPPTGAHLTAVFYSRWVGYLDQVDSEALQDGCRPVLIEPSPDVRYRGTVVLIHAYAACPQQFLELAELLALRGYRSMLVLLPGHGRIQTGTARVGKLPNGRNWRRRYAEFANTINGIMAYAGGERIIGGNSAGAAVSLLINSKAQTQYDRHIVWVPYFQATGSSFSRAADAESSSTDEAGKAVDACLVKRSIGRAGYCGTSATDSDVPMLLGREAFEIVAGGSGKVARLQIIAVEHDTVVSNARIKTVAKAADGERLFACMYPRGVPHSMMSHFDNPDVDMFWLDSLLNGAIGFIADGRPFPIQSGRGVPDSGMHECTLLTERTD